MQPLRAHGLRLALGILAFCASGVGQGALPLQDARPHQGRPTSARLSHGTPPLC